MSPRAVDTREQIVAAADDLFYRNGYEHTSFADIAAAVKLSRGNFYYHFKTKDELLAAVIEARMTETKRMLAVWECEADDPARRIRSFIEMWLENRVEIMEHGCPVGTLCGELAKLGDPRLPEAAALFTLFQDWLQLQFTGLGCAGEAETLARDLLVRSQGVATLAATFHDLALIQREVKRMNDWLDDLVADGGTGTR